VRFKRWLELKLRRAGRRIEPFITPLKLSGSSGRRNRKFGLRSASLGSDEPLRTITGFEVQLALAPIVCKGRDGKKRTFYYAIEDSGPDVIFRVHKSDPPEKEDDFFELKLKRCSNGMYQIENIIGHTSDYREVGIPDVLIPEASRVLKAAIRSSPKADTSDGSIWRTDEADTMWSRLRQNGIARYITDEDYFVVEFPPEAEN
jgi:hypothetical protein